MLPRRVVLDDAHLSLDRIAAVRQLRREMEEMGARFGIAAVSWPGRAGEVATLLPDAKRIDIKELERDRIVEVIEAAGVGAGVHGVGQRLRPASSRSASGGALRHATRRHARTR